jgi:hypothetical protein
MDGYQSMSACSSKCNYYPFPDSCDSVITATAKVMDVLLMTNDAEINASQLAEVYREAASRGARGKKRRRFSSTHVRITQAAAAYATRLLAHRRSQYDTRAVPRGACRQTADSRVARHG